MNKLKLDSKTTALLVIDLQHGIVGLQTQPYPAQSIVEKAAGLVRVFRQMNGKVIFVRVDLANTIASELVLESGGEKDDLVITKRHWSAFGGTDLEKVLRESDIETVVIVGIATNFGVESTARAAASLGFAVVLPEDATTSLSADAHNFSYRYIFPMLGRVRPVAEVADAIA